MAHKLIVDQLLTPINPLTIVTADGISIVQPDSISTAEFGEKAFGLSCLPSSWTLPFFVISKELLSAHLSTPMSSSDETFVSWVSNVKKAAISLGFKNSDAVIVRSSGCSEGLDERGKFHSVEGVLSDIDKTILNCLAKLALDDELTDHNIPLVVQKLVSPVSAKGHLSNERRCSKENRDWLGEFENIKFISSDCFKIRLRNWRRKLNFAMKLDKPLSCNLKVQISEILKIPSTWAYDSGARIHFEWVWDGKSLYIVQADQDNKCYGIDPVKYYKYRSVNSKDFTPKCLRKVDEAAASRFGKIKNVYTYHKLGLPTTQLYILDNQCVIDEISRNVVSTDLKNDILFLLQSYLVIRMDINTDDPDKRQLLPRTEVRDADTAIKWMVDRVNEVRSLGNTEELVFILHNFIPAVSSAFAYAAPGERIVQIEALWGLPEGLYYNSHDKYVVDTQKRWAKDLNIKDSEKFVLYEKINYKHFFVAPDEKGQWVTQVLKPNYDWRPSIQNSQWVREIAYESRRIVEEVGKSLSIMWFVDVPKAVCDRPIFPWHHELYDPNKTSRAPTERTKTPYDETRVIKTYADISRLETEASKAESRVCRIRIQPCEEALLRDKNTLRKIGEIARKISAVILLEGGVLSHAYYQLIETKAVVEVLHPFGEFDYSQDFNKLVRDNVPANIERGGELVTKARLVGEPLLRALREKLTEEAFEVLDAIDQDSIVSELADVTEVVEAIMTLLKVDKEELLRKQKEKKEKAGGFNNGIVLLKTSNPLPTNKGEESNDSLFENNWQVDKITHKIERWSDKREHTAASELKLKLEIPFVLDNWTAGTSETILDKESGIIVQAKLIGKRIRSTSQLEISIYQARQLKLF